MVLADGVANSGYGKREVARAGRSAISPAAEIFTARLAAGLAITALYLGALAMLPLDPARRAVLSASAVFFLGYAAFPDWMARRLEAFRPLPPPPRGMAAGLAAPCRRVPRYPHLRVAAAIWGGSFFSERRPDSGSRGTAGSGSAALPVGDAPTPRARQSLDRGDRATGITHPPTILLGACFPRIWRCSWRRSGW